MQKVLLDTNVWIDFVNSEKDSEVIQTLIHSDIALKHVLVEGELRAGSKYDSNFLELYKTLEESIFVTFPIIFQFIEKEKLYGKGLSIIDISLYASAKMSGHLIWTNDKNLKHLCESKKIYFDIRKQEIR